MTIYLGKKLGLVQEFDDDDKQAMGSQATGFDNDPNSFGEDFNDDDEFNDI